MKKLLILLYCYNCNAQQVKYDTAVIVKLQSRISVIAAYEQAPYHESVLIVKKRKITNYFFDVLSCEYCGGRGYKTSVSYKKSGNIVTFNQGYSESHDAVTIDFSFDTPIYKKITQEYYDNQNYRINKKTASGKYFILTPKRQIKISEMSSSFHFDDLGIKDNFKIQTLKNGKLITINK